MTGHIGLANLAHGTALVDGLAVSGVRMAVVCPGSRSTPVAVALANDSRIRVLMHVDERSAAFFALGIAMSTDQPVALLCSSGTAAANFLPAVVEAFLSRVPLIVLTADRPPELRDWGSAQTIDQRAIYGSHVRWFHELAVPGETSATTSYARSSGRRAVGIAMNHPRGPVHLNLPFREPLLPESGVGEVVGSSEGPGVASGSARTIPDEGQIRSVVQELSGVERGLVVCGPMRDPAAALLAARLGDRLGFPVLADVLSGCRDLGPDAPPVIDAYDAFLRDRDFAAALRPDAVIRVGAIPTSKPLLQFLQASAGYHVVIDQFPFQRDPTWQASAVMNGDPSATLDLILAQVGHKASTTWVASWQAVNGATRDAIADAFQQSDHLTEPRIARILSEAVPRNAAIVLGSSMPVRDADTFCQATSAERRWFANRGANGIDGVVSTALGVALGSGRPSYLLIGDLSFFHDLNGLLAAKLHGIDLTILVVNNDGGGIFSFLPQARQTAPGVFEELFGTPIGLDVSSAATLWGAHYDLAANPNQLTHLIQQPANHRGVRIIELRTDRQENVTDHREIWAKVGAHLRDVSMVVAQ